ncbi:MAG: MFS transporter [Porticoccaceae bacterium]
MARSRSPSLRQPLKILFRNDQFRWLFSSNFAHFFTFSATLLLRSLLAWEITGDEMSLAWINLAAAACILVGSFFSGAVIDRVERRKLILLAQCVLIVSDLSIVILLATGHLQFSYLVISAMVVTSTSTFVSPARTAMVVQVVERHQFGKAMALMAGGGNVARMISPAVAGLIVDWTSILHGYFLLILVHCFTLLCTFHFKASHPYREGEKEPLLREIRDGFVYIAGNRPLAMCILFGMLPILLLVPFQHTMVIFVDHLWGRGASGLGIMMAATGIGGLAGSMLMMFVKDGSLAKPLMISGMLVGLFFMLLSHTPWFWVAVGVVFCVYSSSVLTQTLMQTGVQLMTDEKYRGRVTTMTVMSYGLAPVGTLPLAYAAKHIGPAWGMTITAVVLSSAMLAIWFLAPSFRKIDEVAKTQ